MMNHEIRSLVACLCVVAAVLATPAIFRSGSFLFDRGPGGPATAPKTSAAERALELAGKGDANAQYRLAGMYATGGEIPRNPDEALRWYRRAAEQGHAGAQFNLGLFYGVGLGAPKDPVESLRWYRKAAAQGLADAQYSLGSIYEIGSGTPTDFAEAAKCFRLAADQGHPLAQYNLGAMFSLGEGVPLDKVEAWKWSSLAASAGIAPAAKARDQLEKEMTAEEIGRARRLATQFHPR